MASAKGLQLELLETLVAEFPTSKTVFNEAFVAATSSSQKWLTPDGLSILFFLLEAGASGSAVDNAFCQAARLLNEDALNLLYDYVGSQAMNNAWAGVLECSAEWVLSANIWLTEFFLNRNPERESVTKAFIETTNKAFIVAVDAYSKGNASGKLVERFSIMGVTADVNFRQGEALKIAIRHGHAQLLERLVSQGATRETITQAITTCISSELSEDNLLTLIESLVRSSGVTLNNVDVGGMLHHGLPLIAACLSAHPQYARLAKRLIKLGCNSEIEFQSNLYNDNQIGLEPANVLTWALSPHGKQQIAPAAIEALIDAKANVNFTAPVSWATPLILAAKYGPGDIVPKLLGAKAATIARDCFNNSSLYYASRAGDLKSVKALVKANSRPNDGSLHEASLNLHHEVVGVLIGGKHDPNFPSSRREHEGRNALQELAYKCDGTRNLVGLEQTLLSLEKGKPDPLTKHNGMNALFLSLHNAQPLPVTMAVLDTIMWRHINSEDNVFVETSATTGTKAYFSPTMYLRKGRSGKSAAEVQKLLDILHNKQCKDRFYLEFGPSELGAAQPNDAVGVPPGILKEEEKRRNKEYDHRLKLRHEYEQAQAKAEIDHRRYLQKQSQMITKASNRGSYQ